MRRYAFLQCIRCRHFENKRLFTRPDQPGPTFGSAAYVGICHAATRPEWIVWKSLEWSASHMGSCPDREPLPDPQPECPLFDVTSDSVAEEYPKACVYHNAAVCPHRRA